MKVKILWDHSLEERHGLVGVFGRRSLVEKASEAQKDGDSNSTSTSPIMPSPSQSSSSSLPGPPSYQAQSVEKVSVRSKASHMLKNKAFIAGLCVGVLLLLIVAIILCLIFLWRRTRKKKREHELFNPQKPYNKTKTEGQHTSSKGHSNGQSANRNSPSNELKANRNTPPHGQQGPWGTPSNGRQGTSSNPSNIGQPSGPVSSEQWSAVPPPPPPPMMSSTEMSTSGFSTSSYHPVPPPHPNLSLGFNKSTFTYEDLSAATNGFAKTNLLGQGGFGYVHKGVLPNGKEIAVKSLKSGSGQGEREFQAEVEIISRVHHRHLVSLVGYCMSEKQRMLVYEFVPNGSLEHHLYGRGVAVMDFAKRLRIALGAAKGFAYLHEDCHPRIIHRDIKAANILLDDNFEAMVADFGLAKLSNDEFTHVSTRIMGTFGYLAPEYASSGKLTEKSDVYSYGIVLLELITGRRPVDIHSDGECLIDWARPILARVTQGGSYEELVDARLENHFNHQEMLRMVVCANACIRHSARRRPKMSQIVRALEGDVSLEDLNVVKHSELMGSGSDQESSSNSEIARFMKTAFSSGLTNSDRGVTEDYGHTPSSSDDSAEFRLRAKHGQNQ